MKPTHPTRRHTLRKKLSRAIGLALTACALAGVAQAQSSYTWNGGSGSTGNWTDTANWGGASMVPQAFVNFDGSTRLSSTNNFSSGTAAYQIYFKSTAGAFNLYGSTNSLSFFDFGGGDPNIQNEGTANTQTINFPIANGNNGGTFHILNLNLNTGTSQGPLTFNGTVSSADAGQSLRVINLYGPSAIAFNSVISDFDSTHKLALSQLGSGTTTLRATNTFTGDTTINAGTLVLATNSALANSTNFIRLGDTAATGIGANLNLNGGNNLSTAINVRSGSSGTKIIANTSGSAGNATFAGNLFLDADATLFANSTGGNTLSGATLDLKNQTLTIDGTGTNVISGKLTNSVGSGKLVKNNTGTLTLSGTNVYAGATTINAGALIGLTGGSSSNSAVSVVSGATNGVRLASAGGRWACGGLTYSTGTTYADFNFNGLAPSTTTAPLLVNGNLTFSGTANVIVRSTNVLIAPGQYPLIKYTGALSGTPPSTVFSMPAGMTASISNNTANSSIDLVVTVGNQVKWAVGNAAWDINTSANWTNNVSGPLVNYLDGEAVLFDDTATGASPITVTLSNYVSPAGITANLTNKNYTLVAAAGTGSAVSNAIAAIVGSGPLVKNGSGTLTITATNTVYTGSITLNGGTLALGSGANVGSGTMTMNNGTTLSLPNSGASAFPGNPITVPSGATATFSTTALGNGIAGTVTSGDSTSVIAISGSVSFNAATRQLDPFAGTVSVPSGATLRFSATSGTDGSTNASFVVNGTLQQRNAAVGPYVLGSLSGSGTIGPNQTVAGTGTTTWQVGTNNASTTFSGTFQDFGSGPTTTNLALVKMGTGTFTVSGKSPHSGPTTVGSGALIGVTGASFVNSSVTVNSGATNGITMSTANTSWICSNLTYNAGTCVVVVNNFGGIAPSTTIAPLQVLNNLTVNGTLNFLVSGGSTALSVGTYPLISYAGTLTLGGTITQTPLALPPLVGGYITNDTVNKMIALVVTTVTAPPTLVWSAGTGAWDFSSLNWTNLSGGALVAWADANGAIFNDTASGSGPFTVTLTTNVNPIGVTVSNQVNDYIFTGAGGITGNNSLTKTGAGTLTLVTSNAFGGATTISAGTLSLGNGGTGGTLANMGIVDNGALVINHSDAVAISAVISGTGSFTNIGGGTTTVSVTNTYAGNTTVKAGTLQMTDSGNLSPSSTLVLSGGQFTRATQNFNPVRTNAYKFGLAVTADSTVATTSTSTRTVHFDTANITAVTNTMLLVTNAAATGTNHFKFYAGGFNYAGNLVLGGNGANNMAFLESYNTNDTLPDQIFSGIISGPGKLYKNIEGSAPGGNLIISNAANTFAGGTELRAGYIGLGANNPLGTNSVIFGFDPNPIGFYAVDAPRTLTNDIFADANSGSASTAAGCTNLTIKGSQSLTLSGRILIATNVQFFTVNNSALTTFSGVISNAAANSLGIAKQGSGTLTLAGNNAYNGDTFANVGILRLGAANVIPDGAGKGNVAVADTLDLNTFSEIINGLSGTGIIDTIAGGTPTLTVGNNNATSTFGGQIRNTAGTLALTKVGSGTLNLGGAFTNTYTGLTTVNAGTLGLNSASPGTNAIGGNLLINSGATVNYTTARDEQMPDTANITNNVGTLSFGARTETVYSLNNLGGTNLISSGALFFNGGGYSTNGYFNCTSSGIMQFSNNLTVANGFFDITYAGSSTAGYRILGPDNTGLIIMANATTATTFTNQGNASSGARFLFGPASGQAPVTQVFTSVINVQDIPGVDPDLNMGLILTKSSGFNGSVRKDGLGKMALSVPASSSFTITNFIVNEGTLAMVGAGALYAPQNLVVKAGATLDFTGVSGGIYGLTNGQTFKGNGIIVGTLTNGNSTLAPGDLNSNGLLTVTGNLTSGAGAKVLFDIGGITPATPVNNDPTTFDVLSVSGNLALGGSLSVNLLGGFAPASTDSFTIITNGGTLSGAFANLVSGSRVVVSNNVAYSFQVVTTANAVILNNFSLNAPSVVVNPASTNLVYGNSVTLTAIVGGASPFTYQWYDKNTNAISGATAAALTLNTPPVSASGNYRVIVANPFGTATNSASVTIAQAVSSVAISSSSNPSGYLGALTFTANVTPANATGTVTFFNGSTPFSTNSLTAGVTTSGSISTLARGTNTITAIYGGDVNCFGNTNSLAQVVTNHAPVAGIVGYYRGPVPTWRIKLVDLATNATDVDGDALTITALGISTNGITLTTGGGFGLYYNTNLVNDQFTYTADDGFGGTVNGTVNLTSQAFITGQNATVTVSGSTATVNFAGIPGFNYTAQRSTNLTAWADILTTNAPSGGLFQVIDNFNDLGVVPASAYYRLQYNP